MADEYQQGQDLAATSLAKPKVKTEIPTVPASSYKCHEQMNLDEVHIGNRDLVFALMREGKLGCFYSADKKAASPTHVTLNAGNYQDIVYKTISAVVKRELRESKMIAEDEVDHKTEELSQILANGVCVMTYLKVRSLQSWSIETMNKFPKKPKTPTPFEVLKPFALAISQLGIFKVISLPYELFLKPDLTMEDAQSYFLPENFQWSLTKYFQAVEFAKKIGMEFHTANQPVKLRYSSWWLYKPVYEEGIFQLRCPLPEDNYSVDSAVLRSLFVLTGETEDRNTIFNLDVLGTQEYGYRLRNPHPGINIDVYDAVMIKRS